MGESAETGVHGVPERSDHGHADSGGEFGKLPYIAEGFATD
jgi:hypothetical protein